MERLKADLKAMVAHVATLPRNPTIDQFTNKVMSISNAIQKDIASLPPRIKEIVSQCFLAMGWDVRRQKFLRATNSDPQCLLSALQEIQDHVDNWAPSITPTDEELSSLSKACAKIWELDVHRLVADVDYILNLQQGKRAYDGGDVASLPLFTFVDEKVFTKPTYAAFVALLDNYVAQTGQSEVVTTAELAENSKFLDLVMDTAVMQYVHKYLLMTGKTKANDRVQFIKEINELWFGLYTRKTRNDSSGFEHVFVGEIKEDTREITGFHNWINIYLEEKNKRNGFDYRGFIKPKRRALPSSLAMSQEQLVTIQFEWQGAMKNVSSSFIGTSPEFELALYTLCFYSNNDNSSDSSSNNELQVGPYRVAITCHKWKSNNKLYIATTFPSEVPLDENEAATRIQARVRGKYCPKK